MFGWFKYGSSHNLPETRWANKRLASCPLVKKKWRLTALDEAVLAVPAAIVPDGEMFGNVIHCDNAVRVELPIESHSTPGAVILLCLRKGQSVWLSKSCQAMIVPQSRDDKRVRRFALTHVHHDR